MRNLGRRRARRGDPAWRKTWLGFGRGAERNAPGVGRGGRPGPAASARAEVSEDLGGSAGAGPEGFPRASGPHVAARSWGALGAPALPGGGPAHPGEVPAHCLLSQDECPAWGFTS